jgi:hypothetical protein
MSDGNSYRTEGILSSSKSCAFGGKTPVAGAMKIFEKNKNIKENLIDTMLQSIESVETDRFFSIVTPITRDL